MSRKVFVIVGVWQGVIDSVSVHTSGMGAKKAFRKFKRDFRGEENDVKMFKAEIKK